MKNTSNNTLWEQLQPQPAACCHTEAVLDRVQLKKGLLRTALVELAICRALCMLPSKLPGSSPSTSSTLPSRAHTSSCCCWSSFRATCTHNQQPQQVQRQGKAVPAVSTRHRGSPTAAARLHSLTHQQLAAQVSPP